MTKKLRASSWMVTVPVAVAVFAYLWFYFFPSMKGVGQVMDEVRAKQNYVVAASTLPASVALAQSQLESATTYVAAERQQLVDEPELTRLFANINQLAKQSGTSTTRFEPQAVVEYETLAKLPVSFAIAGPFASVHETLRQLELLPHTVWVEEITIQPAGEDGKTVKCDATLAIFIDRLKKSD